MPDPRSAREEAERLVASLLGTAAVAIQSAEARRQFKAFADRIFGEQPKNGGHPPSHDGFSTGSAACCLCPICRVIDALRDPSPEFAEQLATGAGDLAMGVSGVLRAFSDAFTGRPARESSPQPRAEEAADPWREATRTKPPPPRKPMAKKATKKVVKPVPQDPESD